MSYTKEQYERAGTPDLKPRKLADGKYQIVNADNRNARIIRESFPNEETVKRIIRAVRKSYASAYFYGFAKGQGSSLGRTAKGQKRKPYRNALPPRLRDVDMRRPKGGKR